MSAGEWKGRTLGERTVAYDEDDAILYALAVGAGPDDLDLVFEDRLRVLPGFGLTLAQWAPDVLAEQGAWDNRAVHGSQVLDVHKPLPRSGELRMAAHVGDVWDKGSAAVIDVVVETEYFDATWTIFAPGFGDFGGERGPSRAASPSLEGGDELTVRTALNQALLYRLLGDKHHIHVDPEAAARIGQDRPILHGLCTIVAATLPLARVVGAHPADLVHLEGRFSGPVTPGDSLQVHHLGDDFDVIDSGHSVISDGVARFA